MSETPERHDPAWLRMERLLEEARPVYAPADFVESVMAALPKAQKPFDWLGSAALAGGLATVGAAATMQLSWRSLTGSELISLLQAALPLPALGQAVAWTGLGLAIAYASLIGPTFAVVPSERSRR